MGQTSAPMTKLFLEAAAQPHNAMGVCLAGRCPIPSSGAGDGTGGTAHTLVLGTRVLLAADATRRGAHLISLSLSLHARHLRSGEYRSRFILMYTYELRLGSEKRSFGAGSKIAQYVITGSTAQKLSCKQRRCKWHLAATMLAGVQRSHRASGLIRPLPLAGRPGRSGRG